MKNVQRKDSNKWNKTCHKQVSKPRDNDCYTVTIWIPNTWIPHSSEYPTVWVSGIQMVKSHDFTDHLNTINRLFSVRFSDHHSNTGPFDNPTQIYHLNTRLVRYSDCSCNLFEDSKKRREGKSKIKLQIISDKRLQNASEKHVHQKLNRKLKSLLWKTLLDGIRINVHFESLVPVAMHVKKEGFDGSVINWYKSLG